MLKPAFSERTLVQVESVTSFKFSVRL